ncbi:MAG: histidine kinase [Chloroflexia bacterium]
MEESEGFLRRRIAELRARWPRHSVPPAMWAEMEELEEALAAIERERAGRPEDENGTNVGRK